MTKINLNVPLSSDAVELAVEWNIRLNEIQETDILFSGDHATSFPHVTVVMGYVQDVQGAIDTVNRDLRPSFEMLRGCQLSFSAPYRETETGRYVFVDVVGCERFLSWRSFVRRGTFLPIEGAARTSEVPHVTIAHIADAGNAVDSYLSTLVPLPSCTVTAVELNEAGSKGRRGATRESWSIS